MDNIDVDVDKIINDLKGIVGEDYVRDNIFDRISYAVEPAPYDLCKEDLPNVVVLPADSGEISCIMHYANRHQIPVVVHGSGTSLLLATKPKHQGILFSTKRLNSSKIDTEYGWFECGAGTTCLTMSNELAKYGYTLPMNIGSKAAATMGGVISINTIGHMIDSAYGRPINHVLGLEVVLPTGEIIETGTKSLRRPAGWNLTNFFVGTEGQLGIITKIRMALIPKPEEVHSVGFFHNEEDIGRAFIAIHRSKVPVPLYGEFVGKDTAALGFKQKGIDLPEGSVALVTSIGHTSDEAEKNADGVVGVFKEQPGCIDAYIVRDEELREKIWSVREVIVGSIKETGRKRAYWLEISVALPHLVDLIAELKEKIMGPQKYDWLEEIICDIYGHIGACSLHASFILPNDWSDEKRKEAVQKIFEIEKHMHLKYEGCGGEWGQQFNRIPFFKEKYGRDSYELVKRIKSTFDPKNILNPGCL